jgi:protein PhnA
LVASAKRGRNSPEWTRPRPGGYAPSTGRNPPEEIDMTDVVVRDSNGAILNEGDSVQVIKDLKVKGSSTTLKRGTVFKNIHLTDSASEIECRSAQIKGLVLKTEFVKKI